MNVYFNTGNTAVVKVPPKCCLAVSLQGCKFTSFSHYCVLKMSGFGLLPVIAYLFENMNMITSAIFRYDEVINNVFHYLNLLTGSTRAFIFSRVYFVSFLCLLFTKLEGNKI